MTDGWRVELFDGVSARAREGTARIEGDRFTLRIDGEGETRALVHHDVLGHERIGSEQHVDLRAVSPGAPTAKLVVHGEGFEAALDGFLSLTDARLLGGLRRGLRRIPLWGWLVIVAVTAPAMYFAITGFAVAAHVFVPVETEVALGEAVYEHLLEDFTLCEDGRLQGELQAMVDELVEPNSPYECRVSVFRSPMVNALALPGGRLVVFSGLLEKSGSADEVIGVLAHEVAHVERRHTLKHVLRVMGTLFFMSAAIGGGFEDLELIEAAAEIAGLLLALEYSRDAEREADEVAVRKLHAHERSVGGLMRFFELVRKEHEVEGMDGVEEVLRWLSSHPLTSSRIEMLREARKREDFAPRPWRLAGEDWENAAGACAVGPQPGAGPGEGK